MNTQTEFVKNNGALGPGTYPAASCHAPALVPTVISPTQMAHDGCQLGTTFSLSLVISL